MSTPIFFRDPNLPFVETRAVNGTRACYDKHTHASFSIGTVLNGQAKYWNRRAQVDTGRGSVVIINPEDVHACNPEKDSAWAYRMLFIESDWLAALQREMGLSAQHDLHLFAQTASDDRALYDDLNRLFETLWQPTEKLSKESALVAFLMRLHEQFETDVMALKSNHRLSQAAEFIAAHCLDDIGLSDICQATHLSRSYLIRAFKQQYGMTPHAFLLNQRIAHAQGLLKKGDAIVNVAADCGFADQAHFQRVFKRHVAATPKQYISA